MAQSSIQTLLLSKFLSIHIDLCLAFSNTLVYLLCSLFLVRAVCHQAHLSVSAILWHSFSKLYSIDNIAVQSLTHSLTSSCVNLSASHMVANSHGMPYLANFFPQISHSLQKSCAEKERGMTLVLTSHSSTVRAAVSLHTRTRSSTLQNYIAPSLSLS